jgi:putative nucleotidyltransferase with HDIG domain
MSYSVAMPTRFDVAAVVLAAGRSSRMGAFKPLLRFGLFTVLEHVVGHLRRAGIDRVHVVMGHRAAEMAPVVARLGAVGVVNPDVDRGMYSSVQLGIASLQPSVGGCLLLPVDMPLLRIATLSRIARAAGETTAAVVHPTFRGARGHPPYIGRALFAPILHGDGNGGLRALLAAHEGVAAEVAVFDSGCLSDMDFPEDYRGLLRALSRHHAPDAEECEAMLDAAGTGEPVRRHCRAVATLAVGLAHRLIETGVPLDIDLVRAGALVHDIAKGQPRHAAVGAAMLCDFGFGEVADIVASHMALDFAAAPVDERAVVHLADKLVQGERRVSLTERFAPALERFQAEPTALDGARWRFAQAQAILKAVEDRIGLVECEERRSPPPRSGLFVDENVP